MFNSKRSSADATSTVENRANNKNGNSSSSNMSACVIVQGTVIEGTFTATADTRLDGTIIGTVSCAGRLITGAGSSIQGNIQTRQATISGKIEGDLVAKELVSLESTAVFKGNIMSEKLQVEDGAMMNGNFKVGIK